MRNRADIRQVTDGVMDPDDDELTRTMCHRSRMFRAVRSAKRADLTPAGRTYCGGVARR